MSNLKPYRIVINGTDMGVYNATNKRGALHSYAVDAGYDGWAHLQSEHHTERRNVSVILAQ
jgi:hypothetical protein